MKELKILFPTDFSNASSQALRYVLQFADSAYSSMELIHMMSNPVYGFGHEATSVIVETTKSQIEYAKKQIRQQFDEAMEQVETKGMLDHIPDVEYTIEYGEPKGYLSLYQKINDFDLVAIGTSGAGKKRFGSFTSNLLQRVKCNVLVIPEDTRYQEVRTIVFATDFNDSDPYYLAEMLRVVEPFEPTIHCVHIKKPGEVQKGIGKAGLQKFVKENFHSLNIQIHELSDNDVEKALLDFAVGINAELLAMVAPKYGFIKTLFHKSKTKKMAGMTDLPLLVLKEK